jgi:hypothetical protein
MRVIWIAMVISQLLLCGALFAMPDMRNGSGTNLPTPLVIVAIAALFGASSFRRASRSDGQLTKLGEAVSQLPPPARAAAFYQRTQSNMIISLAIHQAIVMVGFVTGFLAHDAMRALPFLAIALMLDALVFPAPARLFSRARELVPRLGSLAVLIALLSSLACFSFRGGDYTPEKKEPETPCSREAEQICKEKLGSADIKTCIAREKYRCEVVQEEEQKQQQDPNSPKP